LLACFLSDGPYDLRSGVKKIIPWQPGTWEGLGQAIAEGCKQKKKRVNYACKLCTKYIMMAKLACIASGEGAKLSS
jgi:hypothetical protein